MKANFDRKIAIVVNDSVGGICRYSHEIANALSGLGIHVSLICKPSFPQFTPSNYSRCPILAEFDSGARETIAGSFKGKIRLWWSHVSSPVRAFVFCREKGIRSILFSNSFHYGFFVWRFWLWRNQTFALSVHDLARKSNGRIQRFLDRQLGSVYRSTDLLFVHDLATADALVASYGIECSRIHVVTHGIYTYLRSDLIGDDTLSERTEEMKTGLFFGALRDEKGLDRILGALAQRKEGEKWRLIIAGSDSGSQHHPVSFYRRLVREQGIEENVEFHTNYIPDNEVWRYFDAADWVSLAYDESFTSQSGVLATAVFFRKPVLTCGAPLLRKTVIEYGIGVDCESTHPKHLLEGIRKLEMSGSMSFKDGFETFERDMSWNRNAEITSKAFSQVVR